MPVALIIAAINGITTLTPLIIEAIRTSQEMTPEEKDQMLAELMAQTDRLAEAVASYQPLPPHEEPA
jgi:hypothetical protein